MGTEGHDREGRQVPGIRGRAWRTATVLGALEITVPGAAARELEALQCQVRRLETELCESERRCAAMTAALATLAGGVEGAIVRLRPPCVSPP